MYNDGSFWNAVNNFINQHVVGLFVWFFVAIAIGLVASARGRSLPGWFAISLLLSPVVTFFVVMFVLPPIRSDD